MSLIESVSSIIEDEEDVVVKMAHISSLIFHELKDVNWAGFYLFKEGDLVVGPYQGKLACTRIAIGRGVCGTAARERRTICVEDVEQFAGHIACDVDSRSEVVVPLVTNDKLFGVLDVDSPKLKRFTREDVATLERVAEVFVESLKS